MFPNNQDNERFLTALEAIARAMTQPPIIGPDPEEDMDNPPLEDVIKKMVKGESVLHHNRMRVAEYALDQIQRPHIPHIPLGAWATTIQEVLQLMNPQAPKGSVLIERLTDLFNDMQSRR